MRVIFHIDVNGFYASVECLYNPDLRNKPLAVGGNAEKRHGIILAKNEYAKRHGVKTGEALWQAKNKCPDLELVPPDYPLYMRYSKLARNIYLDYTPRIESFGLDECWLDMSGDDMSYSVASQIAYEIKERIVNELGVTVSVGISWNKIFAKLGSDMYKPDGLAVIVPENYKERVWPLPVEELLYVGPATKRKLYAVGIRTIGQLAKADPNWLQFEFGKVGGMLQRFARGEDLSPVHGAYDEAAEIKSIGNSMTTPRDIVGLEDMRLVFAVLTDSVASRLREIGMLCRTVSISVRDTELFSRQAQVSFNLGTDLTVQILDAVMELYKSEFNNNIPARSLGVRLSNLEIKYPEQVNFLPERDRIEHYASIDKTIDSLRSRFGYKSVLRANAISDNLAQVDVKNSHVISPVSFIKGGEKAC